MAITFHKGLSSELRLRLKKGGVRLEEIDAQKALAGKLTKALRSLAASWVADEVNSILRSHILLQKAWEEDHEGENPFPPSTLEKIKDALRDADSESMMETVADILILIEKELEDEDSYWE